MAQQHPYEDMRQWIQHAAHNKAEADPGLIANFVLELMRMAEPVEQQRDIYVSELRDFFESYTSDFVTDLFDAVQNRNKKPIMAQQQSPQQIQPPTPVQRLPPSSADYENAKRKRSRSRSRSRSPPRKRRRTDDDRYPSSNSSSRHRRERSQSPSDRRRERSYSPEDRYNKRHGKHSNRYDDEEMGEPNNQKDYQAQGDNDGAPSRGGYANRRGTRGSRGRGRGGRGGRQYQRYDAQEERPQDDGNTEPSNFTPISSKPGVEKLQEEYDKSKPTLMVTNIPPEINHINKIYDHFKKYGNIANVMIKKKMGKAYVQFDKFEEAKAAHKSPDAILNNRFIKVFWVKRQQTQEENAEGANADKPATGPVSQNNKLVINEPAKPQIDEKEKQEKLKAIVEIAKEKESLLEKQIQLQKILLEKLATMKGDSQAKRDLMAKVKELSTTTSNSLKEQENSVSRAAQAAAPKLSLQAERAKALELEQKKREEAAVAFAAQVQQQQQQAAAAATTTEQQEGAQEEGTVVISAGRGAPSLRRGRGAWRGRGARGAPRMMSLDNRTSTVLVQDLPEDKQNENDVRAHFQPFGEISELSVAGNTATIKFASRKAAEIVC